MAEITTFSARDMANRERLEDYATDALVSTAGGLNLQIAIVCDGAGGGEVGELAARLTARTILGYLEISTETSVPKLLVRAVEEANRIVYGELHGAGTSTLALAAIHLDDNPPYGRLYVASVGDSRIYLLRNGRMVRLNIDHTLGNEYVFAGQMTADETSQLGNPNFATRIIGVSPAVRVDIGFYAERGKDFVNSRRAFHIGQQGMLLEEGDTIFVASDGMFGINEEDGQPFLHDEEILHHALDDDVQRATQAWMRYASARRPDDNIAVSMLFVPSRNRKAVRAAIRMSPRQRAFLAMAVLAVLLLIIGAGFALRRADEARSNAQQTQVSLNETATIQAIPPTATNTPTLTITPTRRPTFQPGQVGVQYYATDSTHLETPVFELEVLASAVPPEISRLDIEGSEDVERTTSVDSADIFMQPPAGIDFVEVDNAEDRERIELLLYEKADIFVASRDFVNGGIEIIVAQDERIVFDTHVLCLAAHQLPTATPGPAGTPTDTPKVAFSCYTGPEPAEENCRFRFSRGAETPIPIGNRAVLDIVQGRLLEIQPIPYEEAKRYYDTIATLVPNPSEYAYCFSVNNSYLDADGDGVPYPDDWCIDIEGSTGANGCPDVDDDGFPDQVDAGVVDAIVDACPDEAGLAEYDGCLPTPTPTETLPVSATPLATVTPQATVTGTPTLTPLPEVCGDGFVNVLAGEECDPPDGTTCDSNCQGIVVFCGDGICDSSETVFSCNQDCPSVCPNGIQEPGEECDSPFQCTGACLLDDDNDGTANGSDACPNDPNKTTDAGACGCGQPETDTDGDGTPNCTDDCPTDPDKTAVGVCGCLVPDTDTDEDGTPDCAEECDLDPNKTEPLICGCGVAETDTDEDGTPDCNDACPEDPNKTAAGVCGCLEDPEGEEDDDGDLVANCIDNCPDDFNDTQEDLDLDGVGDVCDPDRDGDGVNNGPDGCPDEYSQNPSGCITCGDTFIEGTESCDDGNTDDWDASPGCMGDCTGPGYYCGDGTCYGVPNENANNCDADCDPICGNGVTEPPEQCDPPGANCTAVTCLTDTDGDGTADDADGCPTDPDKTAAGVCGCGVADTDTDSDGTPDCNDACPDDPDKTTAGVCGCGVADTDTDSDGIADCNDSCDTEWATEPDGCPLCGNGDQEDGEQCDDGNTDNGDGCDSNCQTE